MIGPLQVAFLEGAKKYIELIEDEHRGAVLRDIEALRANDREGVRTKQLRGKVRELIFGPHRISYFKLDNTLYFVRGFRKKGQRTPKKEIDYAEKIFKLLNSH